MMSWEERRWFDQMVTSITGALHGINKSLRELVDVESQRLDAERMQLHQVTLLAGYVKKMAPHGKIDIKLGEPADLPAVADADSTKTQTKKEKK